MRFHSDQCHLCVLYVRLAHTQAFSSVSFMNVHSSAILTFFWIVAVIGRLATIIDWNPEEWKVISLLCGFLWKSRLDPPCSSSNLYLKFHPAVPVAVGWYGGGASIFPQTFETMTHYFLITHCLLHVSFCLHLVHWSVFWFFLFFIYFYGEGSVLLGPWCVFSFVYLSLGC